MILLVCGKLLESRDTVISRRWPVIIYTMSSKQFLNSVFLLHRLLV